MLLLLINDIFYTTIIANVKLCIQNKNFICRSLEVFKQRGKRHSDILREQQTSTGGSSLGGPLRYPNSVILWLRCDKVGFLFLFPGKETLA